MKPHSGNEVFQPIKGGTIKELNQCLERKGARRGIINYGRKAIRR